jgi:magnesium transporter
MITRHNKKNITWVNIYNPTQDEVLAIKEEFLIHDYVAKDILTPTIRPACMQYEDYAYIVQHFPRMSTVKDSKRRHEIDFILGDHWLITICYDEISNLIDIEKVIDNAVGIETHNFSDVGSIYLEIINHVYNKCSTRLDNIDKELDDIEARIYSGKEKQMVRQISVEMRKIIDFEHALTMHDKILTDLKDFGHKKYDGNFKRSFNFVESELSEIKSRIEFLKDAVIQFQTTNDSLLQHKTADAMKTLTMMSFVIFPLSLIAGIFGMNTTHMPIIGSDMDFYKIILLMSAIGIVFFIFFRIKKWI